MLMNLLNTHPVDTSRLSPANRHTDGYLYRIPPVLLIVALLLWVTQGYHCLFLGLNAVGRWIPDAFWQTMTEVGDARVSMTILLLFAFRHPRLLPATLMAAVMATLAVQLTKHGLPVSRPAGVFPLEQLHIIGPTLTAGSFPSGHTATAGVLAAMLISISRQPWQRIGALMLLSLVGLSRVMVGAHWPIDTLIGAAIGILAGIAGLAITERYRLGSHAWSQWTLILFMLYAGMYTFFNAFPQNEVHHTLKFLGLAALTTYLYQLVGHLGFFEQAEDDVLPSAKGSLN
ncbi:phosphatase PAP2 family protein [Pokkaliibacter sp. MBI-7]|uniref:phosphatase PAP2 family protein n=1 Tax=Pokkaliibacter sp. MBI-7 TaxID=3040600 RepID=UPI00244A1B11|nr:phosphatase PAP2 family protein [Pokkaliibacter sp. MBI-7]MDH2435820.1 phosphatase PAP2 family protein [Pokkaliibacter sp. MBI-7]